LLAYIISAHQIAFTAVADTFGGKAEFRLPHNMNTLYGAVNLSSLNFASKFWQFIAFLFPTYAFMDVISSKGFQKWESGLHPTLLSCLFSVKPQTGQVAYIYFRHGV
jgi:hypothetical protein